ATTIWSAQFFAAARNCLIIQASFRVGVRQINTASSLACIVVLQSALLGDELSVGDSDSECRAGRLPYSPPSQRSPYIRNQRQQFSFPPRKQRPETQEGEGTDKASNCQKHRRT